MILDITGYNTSGSGAFHDLLREFDNTIYPSRGDFEFEILWQVDGIYDLEDKIVNKDVLGFDSDIAIRRFEHLVNALETKPYLNYGKIFENEFFLKASKEYIEDLVEMTYRVRDFSDFVYQTKSDIYKQKWNEKMRRVLGNRYARRMGMIKYMYAAMIEDRHIAKLSKRKDFLELTKAYFDKLIRYQYKNTNKLLITDHMFPAAKQDLYYKYVKDDFKCIIVRRDPRDSYLIAKERYGNHDVPLPLNTVEDFIWFYRNYIQGVALPDTETRITIDYEDLIYKYEETVERIISFVPIGNHILPKLKFDPSKSINNTQLYKYYSGYENDIRKIEMAFPDRLYNFPDYQFHRNDNLVF